MPDIIPEKSYIGLDIGSRWVKVAEIRKSKSGYIVSQVARKEIPVPESDTPESRQKVTADTVNELLKENGITKRKIVLGLPGYQVFVRKMRLPATTEDRLAKIILYEARQQIPFPIDKIQLDYHVKPIPDSTEVEVLLVGSKREIIADYMKMIRATGINSKYLDVTPVGLFNFHKYIDPEINRESIALINIGAATTDISIVREGWLSFTRTAPVGGNDITRSIAKSLNIDFNTAEQIKLKQGRVPLEYEVALGIDEGAVSEDEQKIRQSISSSLDRVVGEIRRTFDYYISQPDGVGISRVILSGGTSRLKNIDGYIGEKLAIPVSVITNQMEWQQMSELKDQFGDELCWITTAVGLALRGAPKVQNTIRIDFLPPDYQDIRNFNEKRLQMTIAGVLLLMVVFVGSLFGSDEISIKQEQTTVLSSKSITAQRGYQKYSDLISRKEKLAAVYDDILLVVGRRNYWLDVYNELIRITPSDVWFAKIQCNDEFKMTVDGKALSEGSVTAFIEKLGKSKFIDYDSNGKPKVKPTYISTPTLDPRLDKTVTSFTFEIDCKPPKAALPKEGK